MAEALLTTMEETRGLDEKDLELLDSSFLGELIRPGDDGYEEARTIYNAMIDKRPGAIARCHDVADVISGVRFAREHGLLLSIRGGGHNGPGLALCDGGLTLDLSPMKGIRVDPDARTVRVQAGCTWGEVDHATHAFGMATVSGIISTTGVPGLTLGGGHGYLSRRYGLTVDNLLEADVVLPDGTLVTASADSHPDLYWALRGGGGNFGVVTSFLFRLHPVDVVHGGPMAWPLEKSEDLLRWYRDWLPTAARELYAFLAFMETPPGPPFPEPLWGHKACSLVWCCTGGAEQAEEAFRQARKAVGEPAFEHVGPMPFPMLQGAFDGLYPPGLQWYWKGDFVREIDDGALAAHLEHAEVPTTHSTMHLYPIDGAVHDVDADATAFGYRDCTWSMVIAGVDPDPANTEKISSWAREYWQDVHPYSAGGAYINFMMEEGSDRIRATYRGNYDRLTEVKGAYDPENLLRVNQNIPPKTR